MLERVEERVYYKHYAAILVGLTSQASENDRFSLKNALNMLLKHDPGLESLPYHIEAAKEYANTQQVTNSDFCLTAGILTKAVKDAWTPNTNYYRDEASRQVNNLIEQGVISATY